MKKLEKLGFQNMNQVAISILVFGILFGFVAYGLVTNVILK